MDFGIFNVRINVPACDCVQGCTDTLKVSALEADSLLLEKLKCSTGSTKLCPAQQNPGWPHTFLGSKSDPVSCPLHPLGPKCGTINGVDCIPLHIFHAGVWHCLLCGNDLHCFLKFLVLTLSSDDNPDHHLTWPENRNLLSMGRAGIMLWKIVQITPKL